MMETGNGGTGSQLFSVAFIIVSIIGQFGAFGFCDCHITFLPLKPSILQILNFFEYYFYTLSITTPLDLDSITVKRRKKLLC